MRHRRLLVFVLAATVAALPPPFSTEAAAGPTALIVDVGQPLGPINHDLVGFNWHQGPAPLSAVAPLAPAVVRIDGSLQDVSVGPLEPLRLTDLLDRVAAVRAIDAEPLVILSYLPAWLGQPSAFGRDPTRVRPSDLDAWERVVHDVVFALATAPAPALRFEAWNEPDIPLFWQDTPVAWTDTVERSARAIAAVEQETGLDLAFGGPATAFPDPAYLLPFLLRLRDPRLPLDFVSWHYYGNHPFFGPDGAEFAATEPIQPIVGRPNPLASPAAYGPQVALTRALTAAALSGSGRPAPALVLDEWNLSAAGFDHRHDSASGAAFAAGVLCEMQDAGLDRAAFFMALDTRGAPGEHGAVTVDGTRKPVWWSFDLWQRLAATQVVVSGAESPLDNTWAVATADDGKLVVLLARFSAAPGTKPAPPVTVNVDGLSRALGTATVRRIDAAHAAADIAEPVQVIGNTLTIELPNPGVALVEIDR